METLNYETKRYCAYCGAETMVNKKRCKYCGSLLKLPIYNSNILIRKESIPQTEVEDISNSVNDNISMPNSDELLNPQTKNTNINAEKINDNITHPSTINNQILSYSDEIDENPISISKKVLITIMVCLIPLLGPLFGLVVGFIYKGYYNKTSQRYSFGKTITIASAAVFIYNIVLFFVLFSIYLEYSNMIR